MHPATTYFRGAVPRIEQGLDAICLLVLVAALLAIAWRTLRRGVTRDRQARMAGVALLAMLALALRLALFPPSFVHANLHGPELVDDILAEPQPASNRGSSFGQATFLVLGLIARGLGPSFETIARTDAVIGVLSLVVVGVLAARWTGRSICLPLALTIGALQPALARIASSEDAHGLGGLLGLAALLGMDAYAVRRDRAALVAAVASAVLMIDSRQTYYVWAPCIVATGIARGGSGILRRGEFVVGAGTIVLALAARVAVTALSEPMQVAILPAALATPRLVWAALRHHPLFDVGRFALGTLPLELLGILVMRGMPMRRAYLVILALTFLVTAPFGFPVPGVECSFRLPVLLLAVIAAAAGGERLWRARGPGRAGLGLAIACPMVLPTWPDLREPSPLTREYVFVRDVASPWLPRDFTLGELRPVDPMPGYRLADAALGRTGRVARVDVRNVQGGDVRGGPVFFLAGLQCRARSGLELDGIERKVETLSIAELSAMALPAFELRLPRGGAAPSTMRDECERLAIIADPVGPELVIDHAAPENPFVFYGGAPVSVRFWRLRSADP